MNRSIVENTNEGSAELDEDAGAGAAETRARSAPRWPAAEEKARLLRERADEERLAQQPVLSLIKVLREDAELTGDRSIIVSADLAVVAVKQGNVIHARRLIDEVIEALRPKPVVSNDQREVLIRTIVSLGPEACAEVARRDKARARRK